MTAMSGMPDYPPEAGGMTVVGGHDRTVKNKKTHKNREYL
jgi:hypothetical protein